jgi:hypothetical protein
MKPKTWGSSRDFTYCSLNMGWELGFLFGGLVVGSFLLHNDSGLWEDSITTEMIKRLPFTENSSCQGLQSGHLASYCQSW